MHNPNRQRGVALITVLLITTLVTLIISDMLARQRMTLFSTANQIAQQQMWQLALSGEAWARLRLTPPPTATGQTSSTNLAQDWAQPTPVFEIGEGRIHVQLEDLSGRFNLNSLQNRDDLAARARYQRLLSQLGLPAHDPGMLTTLIGPDQQPLPFANSSELRRLPQMNNDMLARLAPWLTTQKTVAVNINTASAPVLATLDGMDLSVANALVQARPRKGYDSVQEFLAEPVLLGRPVSAAGLTTRSRDFLATIDIELGDHRLRLLSTLQLDAFGQATVLNRTLVQSPPLRPSSTSARSTTP